MKIGVLTSSRADFGIYLPLLKKLKNDSFFELQLIVFGTHLSPLHVYTLHDIESSGFTAGYKLETVPDGDSGAAIAAAIGSTFTKFGSFWAEHSASFDLVFCLGDRYEMFAAVLSGLPFNIKFAHLHGGEKTLGAIDNVYRHAISHASVLHFASTEAYANRLKEMLDEKDNVFNAGSLSLDNLSDLSLYTAEEFKQKWNIDLNSKPVLVTFHSETVKPEKNEAYANELADLISELSNKVVITMPNADTAGNQVRKIFTEKLSGLPHVKMIENFGTQGYFTSLKYCLFVMGNSSSGIIEAASFGKYVLNIGDRQKGRLQSGNVINTAVDKKAMKEACQIILQKGEFKGENIYHSKGSVAGFIVTQLKKYQKEIIA
jgi:GDP/UDP-N,N'-diacetylbacillosamine 2-epimerase (hydrolysing)